MIRLRELFFRLQPFWRRKTIETSLSAEIQSHIEMATEANIAAGMPPKEARYAALREFGGVEQIKERFRDERGIRWLEEFFSDFRFAARSLRKSPGFTTVAVLTLALGIGANTAMFSLVHAIILRPLPFPNPQQLTFVWTNNTRQTISDQFTSWPTFTDWRTQNKTFAAMTGYSVTNVSLTGSGEPEQLPAIYAADRFLETLGVQPAQGRWIADEEQVRGKESVVVISHGLWLRRFGADPAVVGKEIQVNNLSRIVIGVMPPGFAFPAGTDLYFPVAPDERTRAARNISFLVVVGRLRPGIMIEQAQADLDTITANIERQFPAQKGFLANVVGMHAWTVRNVRTALLVLLGAVGCVLLIACANLANLQLARGVARRREIGVRVAMGAGRPRIVRQLLTESLMLALAGGGAGMLLGKWAVDVIKMFASSALPPYARLGIDPTVLAVAAVACVFCGIGFGLLPAWLASHTDPHEALKEGARGQSASRSAEVTRASLVVAQTALAVVLLIGAGLLLRSFWKLSQIDTGLRGSHLVAMPLVLGRNYDSPAKMNAFREALTERLAGVPGVQNAGLTTNILLPQGPASHFSLEGRPNPPRENRLALPIDSVSPHYFATMGVPLVEGRAFNSGDVEGAPRVAIINETMARMFWPNQSAIGHRFIFGDPPGLDANGRRREPDWITIVGVVKDTRREGPDHAVRIESWKPMAQQPTWNRFRAVVRTPLRASTIARSLREAVWSIDKDLPVPRIEPVAELLGAATAQRRFNLGLLAVFAILALGLAAVGLYGVMAYSVNQRTGEFGIRFALGAQPRDVLLLVLSRAARLVGLGLGLGLIGALAFGRVVEVLLFGVDSLDVLTYASVGALLVVVGLVAAWIPAHRATQADPMTALRAE